MGEIAVLLQELLAQVSLLKPLLYLHEVCPCPWINRGRALTLDAFVYAGSFRQTSSNDFFLQIFSAGGIFDAFFDAEHENHKKKIL